jgi:hypothetical protein
VLTKGLGQTVFATDWEVLLHIVASWILLGCGIVYILAVSCLIPFLYSKPSPWRFVLLAIIKAKSWRRLYKPEYGFSRSAPGWALIEEGRLERLRCSLPLKNCPLQDWHVQGLETFKFCNVKEFGNLARLLFYPMLPIKHQIFEKCCALHSLRKNSVC